MPLCAYVNMYVYIDVFKYVYVYVHVCVDIIYVRKYVFMFACI